MSSFELIVRMFTLIIKAIIILFLLLIFFSLGSALYYLVTDRGQSDRVVKALTWRIALSLVLFALLIIAYGCGWIVPHSMM